MASLSDRFKSLGVSFGMPKQTHDQPGPESMARPIETVITGTDHETIFGKTFITTREFTLDYCHGNFTLFDHAPLWMLSEWNRTPNIANLSINQIAFLDTETSGLAGGTGTYAFLVGLGFFTPTGFTVVQFFMRDPGQEAALLASLAEWLSPFKAIVTFNGKSFDIPLLRTRYVINALTMAFDRFDHLDLLHLARRLWKNRLESRALADLEREILAFTREGEEVSGYLIPQYYFDYLRSKDASPLAGVFFHNQYDIVSLAALFRYIGAMLENPQDDAIPSLDIIALARLYEDCGRIETAAELYSKGIAYGLPEEFVCTTLERFALLRKKQGNLSLAIQIWERGAELGHLNAMIELAKHFEHQQRDYQVALSWTLQALVHIRKKKLPRHQAQLLEKDFLKRKERLEKKVKRNLPG